MVTVLVVDDNKNQRLLYEQELGEEGYRVLLAEEGRQAIAKLHAHIPDVIVIEVGGRVGGVDLLRRLQNYRRSISIIANTARADCHGLVAGLVDACVVKSSDLSPLKTKIWNLLKAGDGRRKPMRMNVSGHNIELTDALRAHIERRLLFALGRFQRRIRRVTVRVFDVNGPRGGVDKTCRVVVDVIPSGRIVVEHTEDDLHTAMDWAAERTGHAVGRELARRREIRQNQEAGEPRSGDGDGVRRSVRCNRSGD